MTEMTSARVWRIARSVDGRGPWQVATRDAAGTWQTLDINVGTAEYPEYRPLTWHEALDAKADAAEALRALRAGETWVRVAEAATSTPRIPEQYYVFTGPDGWAWVEMFYDGEHVTVPGPCRDVAEQVALLERLHPSATVDTLAAQDIADALRYAEVAR